MLACRRQPRHRAIPDLEKGLGHLTLGRPGAVGAPAGYVLLFVVLWVYKRLPAAAEREEP